MTDKERIASLEKKVSRLEAANGKLRERLKTKMKYEKGLLKGTGAHPQLVHNIEQKDLKFLEEVQ